MRAYKYAVVSSKQRALTRKIHILLLFPLFMHSPPNSSHFASRYPVLYYNYNTLASTNPQRIGSGLILISTDCTLSSQRI